jgi:DNA polymerase alpha-associated DNA helicase A
LTRFRYNEEEARLVTEHVDALIQAGLQETEIAIISPYNAQVATIRNLLKEIYPAIEIGSVDGFQGREKEAVLISLVRSNDEGNVGFLKEKRRLNVAMTRAKRHLFVVGDGDLLSRGDEFLKQWIDWLREDADFRYPF